MNHGQEFKLQHNLQFSQQQTGWKVIVYQLVFGRDIIIPIKHTVDWESISQKNHMQINKDNIRKNRNQVDHNYDIGDKLIFTNHAA